MKRLLTISALLFAFVLPAFAAAPKLPDASYKKVSTLVNMPDFLPGVGTLYVKPSTLPIGPFLAYDRDGTLVSTIYMVTMADMQKHSDFKGLATGSSTVKRVDITYNPGHPGVERPHYHVTIWHVDPASAKLK